MKQEKIPASSQVHVGDDGKLYLVCTAWKAN